MIARPTPAAQPSDATEPVAGVRSAFVTAATRRVARRWHAETRPGSDADADPEAADSLLAALALAVDRRRPSFVTELVPRPSPSLGHRLLEMLQGELIRGWLDSPVASPPATILGTLGALEQVRQALDSKTTQDFGAVPADFAGLDPLVEIAHDLRSPLTSIMFLAETLQRGASGEVNPVQNRQLRLIYSAALALNSLVSDAIELARGGDELADQQVAPFSVSELFISVRDIVRPLADEKGLSVLLESPSGDSRLGHPTALSRALLNLTTNALKFTERGFVEMRCDALEGDRVRFAVRDTGPGMSPEALASLYQPFRRGRGSGRYFFSGTGLGLALTRRLVRAMNGELQVETRPGWGTRFFFELVLPSAVSY